MADPSPTGLPGEYDATREFVRQAFVTGAAVMLPIVVTLVVLGFVVDFVSQQLDPVVNVFTSATGFEPASDAVIKFAALLALVLLVFVVGAFTEYRSDRSQFGAFFDTLVSRIPGVGSLYRSLDEMSTLLLDSDTDSFREVKLVEFPATGSYAVAFLTADTPDVVRDAIDHDGEGMVTVFLPMAPNPVMGGHVLHVSTDRVFDVDMTVEEGVQSIVTSGVATGRETGQELPEDVVERFERRLAAADVVGVEDLERYAADASTRLGETSARLGETARETIVSPRLPSDGHDGTGDDRREAGGGRNVGVTGEGDVDVVGEEDPERGGDG